MITTHEFYTVMTAVVPLYVAMILAYGSVRWWKLLTPAQCSGINRFVAIFAVPLLSFQIISHNNPYQMNSRFVAADVLQKIIVLVALVSWSKIRNTKESVSKCSGLDWTITLFMVSTLPNTLVLGIPLEVAMYGEQPAELVVQAVVLQCIVWYTLLLFMYEFRSAKALILSQFPGSAAANIVSFRIDPDVVSLDGAVQEIKTDAEITQDGKIHVQVKRSPVSPLASSKPITPRASDLTGVEIYSLQSSRNMTPTGTHNSSPYHASLIRAISNTNTIVNNNNNNIVQSTTTISSNEMPHYSNHSSSMHTPRHYYSPPAPEDFSRAIAAARSPAERLFSGNQVFPAMKLAEATKKMEHQMLVWSSSTSPLSDNETSKLTSTGHKHLSIRIPSGTLDSTPLHPCMQQDFNTVDNILFQQDGNTPMCKKKLKSKLESPKPSKIPFTPQKVVDNEPTQMPPPSVMTKLILMMMWRKLVRNPNTYASLLGLAWALVSFKYKVEMPKIIEHSITILSDAGLGMAMFSLGLFMALQSSIIACGTTMAVVVMIVRFVTGPAIMSATSIAVGLRNVQLRASIIQAALPQGIVPFVFAKEYNVHPDVLSTAVIFGMLISLPINLLYYVLLGL